MVVIVGIIIHILGSVGINTGQNMQAMGLMQLPEENRNQCSYLVRSKLWTIGCALFISCSIVNFAALTLAPAGILVPLEAVQFVVNVAFGKFVRKVAVPMRMIFGVFLMIAGVFMVVIFGERGTFCFDEDRLKSFWTGWAWWVYAGVTFGISVVCLVAHSRYWANRNSPQQLPHSDVAMPILYAVPSALLGGGQMIVQSKTLSELMEIIFTTDPNTPGYRMPLADWFFWLELVLVSGFGMFWFFRLTQSLGMYEPLFIIPLMQASFIVFGCIAGGIFFQEFWTLHEGPAGYWGWPLFLGGLLMIIIGLYLVKPEGMGEAPAEGAGKSHSPDMPHEVPVQACPPPKCESSAQGTAGTSEAWSCTPISPTSTSGSKDGEHAQNPQPVIDPVQPIPKHEL